MAVSNRKLDAQRIQEVLSSTMTFDMDTAATVRAILPLAGEHGDAIVKQLFQRLFYDHPELQRMFGQPLRISGKHLKAIGDAVCAVVDNPEDVRFVMPVTKQIGQTHQAIQVQPEHYSIVGQSLIAAIFLFIAPLIQSVPAVSSGRRMPIASVMYI